MRLATTAWTMSYSSTWVWFHFFQQNTFDSFPSAAGLYFRIKLRCVLISSCFILRTHDQQCTHQIISDRKRTPIVRSNPTRCPFLSLIQLLHRVPGIGRLCPTPTSHPSSKPKNMLAKYQFQQPPNRAFCDRCRLGSKLKTEAQHRRQATCSELPPQTHTLWWACTATSVFPWSLASDAIRRLHPSFFFLAPDSTSSSSASLGRFLPIPAPPASLWAPEGFATHSFLFFLFLFNLGTIQYLVEERLKLYTVFKLRISFVVLLGV